MRRFFVAAVAGTALIGLGVAPATAVVPPPTNHLFSCNGTLVGGSYDDLIIPPGANCVLQGTNVEHDVRIGRGASFTAMNATLNARVTSVDAVTVDIENSFISESITSTNSVRFKLLTTNVGHDVTVTGTHRLTRIGDATCLVDPSIGGNLTLTNNAGAVAACNLTIGGDYEATGNSGRLSFFSSFIGGGGVHVLNNTGPATRIKHLNTGGVIECRANTSPIFRSNFNQAGQFIGQCQR
jgi:hypothetical protein